MTANPVYAKEVEAISDQGKIPLPNIDALILPGSVEDVAKALEERGIII